MHALSAAIAERTASRDSSGTPAAPLSIAAAAFSCPAALPADCAVPDPYVRQALLTLTKTRRFAPSGRRARVSASVNAAYSVSHGAATIVRANPAQTIRKIATRGRIRIRAPVDADPQSAAGRGAWTGGRTDCGTTPIRWTAGTCRLLTYKDALRLSLLPCPRIFFCLPSPSCAGRFSRTPVGGNNRLD